jgi:hypothetical protein
MTHRQLQMMVLGAALQCFAALACADTKSGEAELQELKGQEIFAKALKVVLGQKLKTECRYYIDPDFLGRKVVSVGANIKNTSDRPMYFGYHVAFFDKNKNLIAASSYDKGKLEPGKDNDIGNVLELESPVLQLRKIVASMKAIVAVCARESPELKPSLETNIEDIRNSNLRIFQAKEMTDGFAEEVSLLENSFKSDPKIIQGCNEVPSQLRQTGQALPLFELMLEKK